MLLSIEELFHNYDIDFTKPFASSPAQIYSAVHKQNQQQKVLKVIEVHSNFDHFQFNTWPSRSLAIQSVYFISYEAVARMEEDTFVKYYVIMPFFATQTLRQLIRSTTTFDKLRCLQQILDAINHLHHLGLYMQNLNPENILVNQDNEIKIINYLHYDKLGANQFSNFEYIAPEQLDFQPDLISAKTDLWSLAILISEIFAGVPVFGFKSMTNSNQQIANKIRQGHVTLSNHLHENLKELILGVLVAEPEQRFLDFSACKNLFVKENKSTEQNQIVPVLIEMGKNETISEQSNRKILRVPTTYPNLREALLWIILAFTLGYLLSKFT